MEGERGMWGEVVNERRHESYSLIKILIIINK